MPDARFPVNPNHSPWVAGRTHGGYLDAVLEGVLGTGPYRHKIEFAGSPTTANWDAEGNIAAAEGNAAKEADWYTALPDAARPRPRLVAFPNSVWNNTAWDPSTNQTKMDSGNQPAGVTQTVTALCPTYADRFEFTNEGQSMDATTMAARIDQFCDSVHAGHAQAKAVVPATVSINNSSLPWWDQMLTALGSTGRAKIDELSFHGYNCFFSQADANRCFAELERILAKHGLTALPRWMTEDGQAAAAYGVFMPRFQAAYFARQLLKGEQYGVPKERRHLWYGDNAGFWDIPYFWFAGGLHVYPGAVLHRTWSAEVHSKTHTARIYFGADHDDAMAASTFTDAGTGAKVQVYLSDHPYSVPVVISGASTVNVVDAWGNVTATPVVNGRVTLAMSNLPTYVRLPAGVTATPDMPRYGINVARKARGATIAAAQGSTRKLDRVIDRLALPYYFDADSPTHDEYAWSAARDLTDGVLTAGSAVITSATAAFTAADVGKLLTTLEGTVATGLPWIPEGTTILSVESPTSATMSANATTSGSNVRFAVVALPASLTIDWPRTERVTDVRLWSAFPRHSQAVPTHITVETRNADGTWTTRATYGPVTPSTWARVGHSSSGGHRLWSFWDEQWIFDFNFAQVVTSAIRVTVHDSTPGGAPTPAAQQIMRTESPGQAALTMWPGGRRALVARVQVWGRDTDRRVVRVT
ncbi:MAG: hypothetical protein M3404_05125 [Actinomycetota bacterium]|nr:hypothetical protein [Actinomycetota bacterium]